MTERYSTEHYVIVRVREKCPTRGTTALSRVRKATHTAATEYDLSVSDIPIMGDRYEAYYGGYGFWSETAEIFGTLMSRAKAASAARRSSCPHDCNC